MFVRKFNLSRLRRGKLEIHVVPDPAPALPPPPSNLKETLETASKTVIFFFGLCYVLGLIVNNLHLSQYGYFSLSLLQLNYIFAGFWTLVPIIVGALVVGIAYLPFALDQGQTLKVMIFMSAAMLAFAVSVVALVPRSIGFEYKAWPWVVASMLGLMACGLLIALVAPFLSRDKKPHPSYFFYFFILFAFLLATYLSYFTKNIYHEIPSGMGGGRPAVVRFVVAKDAKPYFDASGIPVSEQDNKSEPVDLLLNSAEGYVVKSKVTGGTVVIPQAPVRSVLFDAPSAVVNANR